MTGHVKNSLEQLKHCRSLLRAALIPTVFEFMYFGYHLTLDRSNLLLNDRYFVFSPLADAIAIFMLIGIRFVTLFFVIQKIQADNLANAIHLMISIIPILGVSIVVYLELKISEKFRNGEKSPEKPHGKLNFQPGHALIIPGIFLTGFMLLIFDTTVPVSGNEYQNRVSNTGLMQTQMIGVVIGGVMFIAGFISLLQKPK